MKAKVCSFNLRVDAESDGINRLGNRKSRILEVINAEMPDIIGFQEARDKTRFWLADSLAGYSLYGCGRNPDGFGESTAVAVRRDLFSVISCENFWLSNTPSVAGSTYGGDQSNCSRICTALLLSARETGERLHFVNTHLDHKGANARLLGIKQVIRYISSRPEKFVLTGDFNTQPDSPVVSALNAFVHEGRPVRDLTSQINNTFHGFGTLDRNSKIDYIFTDAAADLADSKVIDYPPVNGIYVSDHHPVVATIEF